jgi:hypothetical protein
MHVQPSESEEMDAEELLAWYDTLKHINKIKNDAAKA